MQNSNSKDGNEVTHNNESDVTTLSINEADCTYVKPYLHNPIRKACVIYLDRNKEHDEMDLDYSIIEEKVKELNDLGVDISLQEIGDIIESKFVGKPYVADLKRWREGVHSGKLLYPQYTLIRDKLPAS